MKRARLQRRHLAPLASAACGVALVLSLGASAQAAPILLTNAGGDITGIADLEVNGTSYHVTFVEGSYDAVFPGTGMVPTFLGDQAGAQSAANAIINVFNSESVEPVDLEWFNGTNAQDADIVVPWRENATTQDAFNADWTQASGPWALMAQTWSRNFDNDRVAMAKFTRADPIPEPGAATLFGVSALLLGLAGRPRARR